MPLLDHLWILSAPAVLLAQDLPVMISSVSFGPRPCDKLPTFQKKVGCDTYREPRRTSFTSPSVKSYLPLESAIVLQFSVYHMDRT